MNKLILLVICSLVFMVSESSAMHILPYHEKSAKKEDGTHSGHMRKAPLYQLMDVDENSKVELSYYLSNLEKIDLEYSGKPVKMPRGKNDNYHAIIAKSDTNEKFVGASYYIYKYGKPSNVSPTKITLLDKLAFEIKPNPLPKEHDEYKTSKKYGFIVTLNAKPISTKINLQTLNGTTVEYTSDEDGRFSVILPNDFKDVKNSKRANRPSHFILSSKIKENTKEYETSFTMPYHVNPNDYWQNSKYGGLVALLGLVFGILIYRKSKNG
ncbi:hypothetical protein GJV85_11680 [Sulfurimonas aquatica]|uniref:DUF4198 domain-containing protein n=1 Tax=Sulfurimonas aquatica TaxID=2672570 RepID=A0A975B241_9BACT|nr:hypothetical protein [Sulfurimonas aquatica]QSZ42745.1 hypothetical protein GJV85_11680 [Sulfurimonas aquatica]